jgi:hypothetical protein
VLKLRPLPRLLLTAVLACQLMVGAPVHAQPVAMAPDAPAEAAQPMAAHCAGHAAGHAMEQATVQGDAAVQAVSNHHDAGSHDKGCCGDSQCATGACASHCAGVIALTSVIPAGMHAVPAGLASALLAGPRVERRSFGFFRPPI